MNEYNSGEDIKWEHQTGRSVTSDEGTLKIKMMRTKLMILTSDSLRLIN